MLRMLLSVAIVSTTIVLAVELRSFVKSTCLVVLLIGSSVPM